MSAPTNAAEPTATEEPFRIVGKVPVAGIEGGDPILNAQKDQLILDTRLRRGYIITYYESPPMYTVVQSFDLDTLKVRRRAEIPGVVPIMGGAAGSGFGEVMHAVDEAGGRLVLALSTQKQPEMANGRTDGQRPFERIDVIDQRAFDRGDATFSTSLRVPDQQAALLRYHGLRGMHFHRHQGTGRLLLLWAGTQVAPLAGAQPRYDHQLVEWGVDRPTDTWEAPALLVDPCGSGPLTSNEIFDRSQLSLGILRTADRVALVCGGSEKTTTVVVATLDGSGRPTGAVTLRKLHRMFGDVLADQAGGRLLVKVVHSGTTWWSYDLALDAWTGAFATASDDSAVTQSTGLDPSTGRFYALVPNHTEEFMGGKRVVRGGFVYTDSRLDPPPQPFLHLRDFAYPAVMKIGVDPEAPGRPRRLFVRRGGAYVGCQELSDPNASPPCDPPIEGFYTVLEDRAPVSTAAASADVDRYTVDVDEQSTGAATGASFSRAASGFGARLLVVGGVSGAVGMGDISLRTYDPGHFVANHGSPCTAPDRRLVLGEVAAARADDSTASADARGLDLDAATQADLADPLRRCWGVPWANVTGPFFPSSPPAGGAGLESDPAESSCSGNGSGPAPDVRTGVSRFRSSTECDQAQGRFATTATGSLALGDLEVGHGTTTARVVRDEQGRLATEVVATAEGVRLGALATIGRVTTRARAAAGGRPGSAGGTFTREVCDVHVPGVVTTQGCLTPDQQKEFVTGLNRLLGSRGRARMRTPDAEYLAGSPGGYQAAVQRRRVEALEDNAVHRDTSKAVPGLEIEFYSDHPTFGAARRLLQLAAVEASNQYGIYCLHGLNPAAKRCNGPAGTGGADTTMSLGLAALVGGGTAHADAGTAAVTSALPSGASAASLKPRPLLQRVLRRLADLPASALRIITSNPRELLLLAGVWALVWMPCVLAERRRYADGLVARRGT
jgi:hypothetical protein